MRAERTSQGGVRWTIGEHQERQPADRLDTGRMGVMGLTKCARGREGQFTMVHDVTMAATVTDTT